MGSVRMEIVFLNLARHEIVLTQSFFFIADMINRFAASQDVTIYGLARQDADEKALLKLHTLAEINEARFSARLLKIESAMIEADREQSGRGANTPISALGKLERKKRETLHKVSEEFEKHCTAIVHAYLADRGYSSVSFEDQVGRLVKYPGTRERTTEVDILCRDPFVLGECTFWVRSLEKVSKFLRKIPLVKEKVGKVDEEPILFFFSVWVDPEIEAEVIQMLEEAKCHWHLGGKCSDDMRLGPP